jgi:hypothetical protein
MWKVKRMNTARIVVPAIESRAGRPEPAGRLVRARRTGAPPLRRMADIRFTFGIPVSMTAQT